jgi:hypothetical protein
MQLIQVARIWQAGRGASINASAFGLAVRWVRRWVHWGVHWCEHCNGSWIGRFLLVWNNWQSLLWQAAPPGTTSMCSTELNDPQRHMTFCLQSSSCLSRIPPVHPQCITNNSQQVVLLLSTQLGHQFLPLAPRTPNLQPNLCNWRVFSTSWHRTQNWKVQFMVFKTLQISSKKFVKILMPADWRIVFDGIVLYFFF